MAYCSAADMETCFGPPNILAWATLSSSDDATAIAARKTAAIAFATEKMDEVLRCIESYESKLPLSTVPVTVQYMVAIDAALWMYGFRASDDFQKEGGVIQWRKEEYDQWVTEVREGKRKLDIK